MSLILKSDLAEEDFTWGEAERVKTIFGSGTSLHQLNGPETSWLWLQLGQTNDCGPPQVTISKYSELKWLHNLCNFSRPSVQRSRLVLRGCNVSLTLVKASWRSRVNRSSLQCHSFVRVLDTRQFHPLLTEPSAAT